MMLFAYKGSIDWALGEFIRLAWHNFFQTHASS